MRTFYNLLGNTIIATVTNMTVWFALIFFGYLETQSVLVTSVMSGIFLVATALTGFWLGSLVDRYKKKRLMIISSFISLVIYFIGLLIYLSAGPNAFKSSSSLVLWIFVPLVLAGVLAGNLRNITLPALIPLLVDKDKIDKANGLAGTASGISFLIVSVISGILVGHSGMLLVLILAIISSILAIVHLLTIKIPENKANSLNNQESNTNEAESFAEEQKTNKVDIRGTIKILRGVPGLISLIFFTTFNNFLGGVFMSLMDAYGLSLVSVEVWGILWGFLSLAFIIGGMIIAKKGLGKNPLRTLFLANIAIWTTTIFFTIQPSILLLTIGAFIYLTVVPFIEASEHTIIQKVVPQDRLGRVFGFAQSVEQSASPLTAFAIGPITQLLFIPFMTDGTGAKLIGSWFGTGANRGIALVFTLAGIIGLIVTISAMRSRFYKNLSNQYLFHGRSAGSENL